MANCNYIAWLNDRAMRGEVFFTKEDFLRAFSGVAPTTLEVALSRAISRGEVAYPWQNFYVVIPTEYKLKRIVPPHFYINELMSFLNRNYYVSLLTAATTYGASHQRDQTFFVTADGVTLRDSCRIGTVISFTQRKEIPLDYVRQVKTQTGFMNVSSPLMTALDLVYMESKVGGLSRVAEVMYELDEAIEPSEEERALLRLYPAPVLQRLGYILSFLGFTDHADWLYACCKSLNIRFKYVPLRSGHASGVTYLLNEGASDGESAPLLREASQGSVVSQSHDTSQARNASQVRVPSQARDRRWKLFINTNLEIDEL